LFPLAGASNFTDALFGICFIAAEFWDPFRTKRSLKEMLNSVDRVIDAPFFRSAASEIPSGIRRPSDLIEDSDAYKLRIDMPGLSREEVSISYRTFVSTKCSFLQLLSSQQQMSNSQMLAVGSECRLRET
jgi:hypothetical protein